MPLVETAIDMNDLRTTEVFYRDLLGIEVIGREAGRHVFFRVGNRVLMAFREKEGAVTQGGRSLSFRDPTGNTVKLVTPGLRGLPGEW